MESTCLDSYCFSPSSSIYELVEAGKIVPSEVYLESIRENSKGSGIVYLEDHLRSFIAEMRIDPVKRDVSRRRDFPNIESRYLDLLSAITSHQILIIPEQHPENTPRIIRNGYSRYRVFTINQTQH